MPWRLIGFIFVFIVFLVFIGFNLENKCDISFGFKTLTEVPVFYTIFVSFALGVLVTLPVVLSTGKKRAALPSFKLSIGKKDNKADKEEAAGIAEEFNEPAPSYSGGKYFDKNKFKKK